MKRVDENFSINYSPLVLDVNDIRELCDIIKSPDKSLQIKSGKFIYDDIDEFIEKNKDITLHELEILESSRYISLDFDRLSARLYTSSSSSENMGIVFALDSLLKKKTRKPLFIYTYWTVILSPSIYQIFSSFVFRNKPQFFWIDIFFTFIVFLFVLHICFVNVRKHSIIHVMDSRKLGFFKNNMEKIVVALISALVTATFGYFGPIVWQKLTAISQ
jgi:hypothetical protein